MYKFLIFIILSVTYCSGTVIKSPTFNNNDFLFQEVLKTQNLKESELKSHLKDFLKLIDLEKVMGVAIPYMHDAEVLQFLTFMLGPEFKKIVIEMEKMEEFKEMYMFLSAKGYDIESLINYVNSALNLPAFEKPLRDTTKPNGISGLIAAVIGTLPMPEMKELFEAKLESSPEVAYLFETLRSAEFTDIIVKMFKHPKMIEWKKVFESYGIDFRYICDLVKEITGEYFQGILCKSRKFTI